MKRFFPFFVLLLSGFFCSGQVRIKTKKYPSLLWEISGNGMKKPSYLFGTMHVSNKLAFHLSDSFYVAIKNTEVVALETNPESWQEDMDHYDVSSYQYARGYDADWGDDNGLPDEYLTIGTLRFNKYEKFLEKALFSQPSVINNLLYRNYSENSGDFEEDTYLDLYIYQTGKRLGKKVAGVESYGESMKLMAEAYRDAAKDKAKKPRSYDYGDYSTDKLQDAYRNGNLDLLDSINRVNSYSTAFDEKFLYRRNEIQANSIDSILKRSSLFVGVGAAHLPGSRGVIELLRRKGYRLRPVIMGPRDSRHKDEVEKVRVPVVFANQSSDDGFFKVDIPGKFYSSSDNNMLEQQQYADMANGSFYMVTRVRTDGLFWGHDPAIVEKKIDSLLYENVPGKILIKTPVTRNGYRGLDITNRTRRGDYQRYNIFITPYEVLFFKMSGTGEYVKNGEEANRFFSSIQLKEFKGDEWKIFQPVYGGFSVDMPASPVESIDGVAEYDAQEKNSGIHFKIIRADINNYNFAEEDTFDLNLLDESYASSLFIDKKLSQLQHVYKGYPSLDCKYLHKDGSLSLVRFIIQGPHYYMLVSHGKKEEPAMHRFLNSFEIKPFVYNGPKTETDSSLHYTVTTTWYPTDKKEKIDVPNEYSNVDTDENAETSLWDESDYKSKVVTNDTTGEKIVIAFYRSPKYFYIKDSAELEERTRNYFPGSDTSWIVRSRLKSVFPGGMNAWESVLSDTNSSRTVHMKIFYKNGYGYMLMTQGDTLTPMSSFIKGYFDNFRPADTIGGVSPFEKKSKIFFADLFNNDSTLRQKAISSVSQVEMDSTDVTQLKKAIASFGWDDKKYLDTKVRFINKVGKIVCIKSADMLKDTYYAAGDTIQIQNAALESLLKQQTQYAFNLFRDIIANEPPILERAASDYSLNSPYTAFRRTGNNADGRSNGNFIEELYDSLQLTRTILPELLPLINLDDYKWPMMRLLATMLDSGLVKTKDYESYFSKFYLEAKQEMRKQIIAEKKKAIEKAEEEKDEKRSYSGFDRDRDAGNRRLNVYADLLLPFYKSKSNVADLIKQLLQSGDKRLRYNTMLRLLQNEQAVPDTLISYFASLDEFRYELFTDLKELKKAALFPAVRKNHLDLARSRLLRSRSYSAPDSLVFIDKLKMTTGGRTGYVYFFRYKSKKDDVSWKLATDGLIPLDPGDLEFEENTVGPVTYGAGRYRSNTNKGKYDFTWFSNDKLKDEEPLMYQLDEQLKKLLIAKRKSGKMFFSDEDDSSGSISFTD